MNTTPETSNDQPAELPVTNGPLRALQRRRGAEFAPYRGVDAAATYGDEAEEYEALRAGCGLIDRSWVAGVEMLGEDRARFLNGLVTCDTKSLESGQGVFGFLTTVKGRVMADVSILALDDRLWLELPPGTAPAITEHLSKYVIVDRVEIAQLENITPLTLIGPTATDVLGLSDSPETIHAHHTREIGGADVRIVREPPLAAGSATWTLWVQTDDAAGVFEHLLEQGTSHGLRAVGHRAFDRLRIEAGQPFFGVDYSLANFPQETGLGDIAVSYTKGCYLGQEIVARIHYRGGVNRHLRGLVFAEGSASAAECVGRSLAIDGREVGTVTSAAAAGSRGSIGLAILHQRAEPGAAAELAGGGTARVIELPFGEIAAS